MMTENQQVQLNNYLEQFLTDSRRELIDKNLSMRTRYLAVVLEDIYQSQNASAVLRTCDCFGIQDLHVIENRNIFHINKDVVRGASQWVDVQRYKNLGMNTTEALSDLKKKGYRIVATSPHLGGKALPDFNLNAGKAAIVFGSENLGISKEAEKMADEFLFIPMVGFTESLNISVSAAVVMQQLTHQLRLTNVPWQLSTDEYNKLKYKWLCESLKKPELLVQKFFELNPTNHQ